MPEQESGFFGDGQAFLWRWDDSAQAVAKSTWTRAASDFQFASSGAIAIGGGGGTYGLWLVRRMPP
jgi:hypothetical protein